MADHSESKPRHSSHEQPHHLPPSPLPALAAGERDTAVILLASATAVFLALAVVLSIMLWRDRSDSAPATRAASAAPAAAATAEASAAAQPVIPAEPAVSAAAPTAEETGSAEATAEASSAASAEASTEATVEATLRAEETTDPDAAAADESGGTEHSDELPTTGAEVPLLAATGVALIVCGLALVRLVRRRVTAVAPGVEISAVDALWLFLEQTRRRPDDGPQARHVSPSDQTDRLRRVAEQASRRR